MFERNIHATHPDSVACASTSELRSRYLITSLFRENAISLTHVHQERLIIGGALCGTQPLFLPRPDEPPSAAGRPFLENREMAIVNISAAPGIVSVEGIDIALGPRDALYLPRGTGEVSFRAREAPVRFYLASTPAHRAFALKHIPFPEARTLRRGTPEASNVRSIHQFVVPGVCESAQLLVGLTVLEPGSVWNTMPPHTHDRRSEVYFYFGLGEQDRAFHFMGLPDQMRHLVVANEEAVICPPWSVHMGAGTSSYAFIWAMGGENLDYDDMQPLDICQLA